MRSGRWGSLWVSLGLFWVGAAMLSMSSFSCQNGSGKDSEEKVQLGNQLKRLSDTQDAFAAVAELSSDFVVSITVRESGRNDPVWDWIFGPPDRVKGGTGIVLTDTGWILTNRHVVERAASLVVRFADGREFKGERFKAARDTDLAFIKINGGPFQAAKLGDSDRVRVGDWAIAVGSPFNFDQTLTVGVISAKGRKISRGRSGGYETFLQTDAAINAGNSGGPLLNLAGEVIGVNTAIFSPTRTYAGIGFAIPINRAKELLDHLSEEATPQGQDEGGWLGVRVRELHDDEKAQLSLKGGLVVLQVVEGSPANVAGMQEFDVLLEMDGKALMDREALVSAIEKTQQGQEVVFRVLRGGRLVLIKCCVGKNR